MHLINRVIYFHQVNFCLIFNYFLYRYLEQSFDSSEFVLDKDIINAFIRFPGPLYLFKNENPDLLFAFNFNRKLIKNFEVINELKYFDEFYEKVAKVRLPYIIPDNFKLPCLMIYNALLAMINSGEDELETLYGDKEVTISKDNDMLIIKFEDKNFNLQSRPVSNVIVSLASSCRKKTTE